MIIMDPALNNRLMMIYPYLHAHVFDMHLHKYVCKVWILVIRWLWKY